MIIEIKYDYGYTFLFNTNKLALIDLTFKFG